MAQRSGLGRGVALRGTVWPGGEALPMPDSVVVVAPDGKVAAIGPAAQIALPEGVRLIGGTERWVGPGIVDAHVHLAFAERDDEWSRGVVAVRDLGAPPAHCQAWRAASPPPQVVTAGQLLTAPGGYPSRTWGAGGFTTFIDSPLQAQAVVRAAVADGVDLVKLALEPADDQPVPSLDVCRTVVIAAHDHGLPVTAHALTAAMVQRALDAGVDELCHVPVEPLSPDLVGQIAMTGMTVVSTIETLCSGGDEGAARNGAKLVAAGVPLAYGTDLGNVGTRPGIDIRELRRLEATGLGRPGALKAATAGASDVVGMRGGSGHLVVGTPAAAIVLAADPLGDLAAFEHIVAVVSDGVVLAA